MDTTLGNATVLLTAPHRQKELVPWKSLWLPQGILPWCQHLGP